MSRRETNYDLLRSLSCFLVIILHWGCFFCGKNYQTDEYAYIIGYFAQSISRFAVPCFIMLSGAFVLQEQNALDIGLFWRKTIKKLVLPIISFSVVYVLFSYVRLMIGDGNVDKEIFKPLVDWLKGIPYYHMWYAYMLMGLYFVAPFIQKIKKHVDGKQYFRIIVIMCFVGIFLEYYANMIWCLQFVKYSGYFMLGDYIRNSSGKDRMIYKHKNLMLLVAIIVLMTIFGFSYVLKDDYTFYQPMSPLVICSSVLIFMWFSYTEININTEWLAKQSLYIYILHAGIMDCMNIFVTKVWGYPSAIWYFPVGVIFTLLGSLLGSQLIIIIKGRMTRNFSKNNG